MRLRDLISLLFEGIHPGQQVLFRVDAGRLGGLSFGHLMRCHYLAQGLRDYREVHSVFLMEPLTDGIEEAKALGEKVVPLSPGAFRDIGLRSRAVVFDLPEGPAELDLAMARQFGLRSIVIDDVNRPVPWAHVILNSSILAAPDPYPEEARLLLGPDYLIVPESFERATNSNQKGEGRFTVLITFGGSDPTGLTTKVMKALSGQEWPGVVFEVVLGPGFTEGEQVRQLAKGFKQRVEIATNPPDILPHFARAALAICAGGRTMYELSYLEKKFLPIASTAYEGETIGAFIRKGMIPYGLTAWKKTEFMRSFRELLRMEGAYSHEECGNTGS
jgi:spore coat polysaccharide biosynthesis predicted glycosyltransferase SpsG